MLTKHAKTDNPDKTAKQRPKTPPLSQYGNLLQRLFIVKVYHAEKKLNCDVGMWSSPDISSKPEIPTNWFSL